MSHEPLFFTKAKKETGESDHFSLVFSPDTAEGKEGIQKGTKKEL